MPPVAALSLPASLEFIPALGLHQQVLDWGLEEDLCCYLGRTQPAPGPVRLATVTFLSVWLDAPLDGLSVWLPPDGDGFKKKLMPSCAIMERKCSPTQGWCLSTSLVLRQL